MTITLEQYNSVRIGKERKPLMNSVFACKVGFSGKQVLLIV